MKIDLNTKSHAGESALFLALKHSRLRGGVVDAAPEGNGIAEFLIAKGIDFMPKSHTVPADAHEHLPVNIGREPQQRTMLHEACRFRCPLPIRFLLQKSLGVDIDMHDDLNNGTGGTPLHECATRGHHACATILLEKGANVNVVDHRVRLGFLCHLLTPE